MEDSGLICLENQGVVLCTCHLTLVLVSSHYCHLLVKRGTVLSQLVLMSKGYDASMLPNFENGELNSCGGYCSMLREY